MICTPIAAYFDSIVATFRIYIFGQNFHIHVIVSGSFRLTWINQHDVVIVGIIVDPIFIVFSQALGIVIAIIAGGNAVKCANIFAIDI
jgi:hypothetical protein